MNKITIPILALSLFVFAGCQLTPKKIAYQTLSGVGLSVQKSMQAAAAGRAAGKIGDDDWAKIVKIHDTQYLPSYRTACDLASHDYNQFAPADLIGLQAELITLVNQLLR